MKQLTIIKIGGKIIDDAPRLLAFLNEFAAIQGYKILVHGGGKIATAIGDRLGIRSRYIAGRRITDDAVLELVTMVYGGLINKRIVACLQAGHCNAIGLTGADANMAVAIRRPAAGIDYGHVGDIQSAGINKAALMTLLACGMVPVIAPLTHDGKGNLLNTNADTIAQEIAKALAASFSVRLVYCFEKKGVLMGTSEHAAVIGQLTAADFEELVSAEVISGGMIPKLKNALVAIDQGVDRVTIGQAEDLMDLISGNAGTQIV